MIDYILIDRAREPRLAVGRSEGGLELDDRAIRVEMTLEQHFGLRVFDDAEGRTWIELREGGEWTPPVALREFMWRNLSATPPVHACP